MFLHSAKNFLSECKLVKDRSPVSFLIHNVLHWPTSYLHSPPTRKVRQQNYQREKFLGNLSSFSLKVFCSDVTACISLKHLHYEQYHQVILTPYWFDLSTTSAKCESTFNNWLLAQPLHNCKYNGNENFKDFKSSLWTIKIDLRTTSAKCD